MEIKGKNVWWYSPNQKSQNLRKKSQKLEIKGINVWCYSPRQRWRRDFACAVASSSCQTLSSHLSNHIYNHHHFYSSVFVFLYLFFYICVSKSKYLSKGILIFVYLYTPLALSPSLVARLCHATSQITFTTIIFPRTFVTSNLYNSSSCTCHKKSGCRYLGNQSDWISKW